MAIEQLQPSSIVSITGAWNINPTLTNIGEPWATPDTAVYAEAATISPPSPAEKAVRIAFNNPVLPPSITLSTGGIYILYTITLDPADSGIMQVSFFGVNGEALGTTSALLLASSPPNSTAFFALPRALSIVEAKALEISIRTASGDSGVIQYKVVSLHINTEDGDLEYVPNDGRYHKGLRTRKCSRCGFPFREDELVYRNGALVCRVAGTKSSPCYDEQGYKEFVDEYPLDLGPKPDSGIPPWPY